LSKSKRKKRLSLKAPRRLRTTRASRLQSALATNWVAKHQGEKIVSHYRKWFGVDLLCAIAELRLLGVPVDQGYEAQVRRSVDDLAEYRKRKKRRLNAVDPQESGTDCDGTLAYIAGYTPGGVPFGVTWEEAGQTPPWEP
jgi:hypothetical protein